jgi:hypothetical protein
MSDVEILGRTLYRPVKNRLQESSNSLVKLKPEESKRTPLNTDFVYERDEGDWWWCEDV